MMKVLPKTYNLKLIEETTPALRYDSGTDFATWQGTARTKLAELLGLPNMKKAEDDKFTIEYQKGTEEYTEYRFTLQSEEGYVFPAVMRVPRGREGRLPVMLALQGHATGMHISLGDPVFPGDTDLISGGDRDFVVMSASCATRAQ